MRVLKRVCILTPLVANSAYVFLSFYLSVILMSCGRHKQCLMLETRFCALIYILFKIKFSGM